MNDRKDFSMGDTLSEYLHMAVGAVIFASAMAFFLSYIGILGMMNKSEIEDMNRRSSVTMDTETGFSDDVIYIKGSEAYADILSIKEGISVILDGTEIPQVELERIRDDESFFKQKYYTLIHMNDDYIINYQYYSNNGIKAVSFTHR